ncbi:MAG: 50S ribosomal protein L24 [Planctomycetaceae bacterium]|nr:MAG: 50S ribosomal protein L24 [Planctomycetaceae bacterium]
MRIRKGDEVIIMTGDDKSDSPRKVLEVFDDGRKLVVENVNRVWKHVKRGHPKSPQGGRLSLEMPIDASNVLLFCTRCQKGVRVGFKYREDGTKIRCCRKCQADLGVIGAQRSSYARKS